MAVPGLRYGDAVEVTYGEEKGQRGTVNGYNGRRKKYQVKIPHEGFPENHVHLRAISPRYLKKVEFNE